MQIAYLDSDRIRVQMRDDGCGFDPEKASRELGHWGLIIMRERARQLGGELKISSAPGRGTELDIVVPLSRPAE
jgi:signal transduction histidine kinase